MGREILGEPDMKGGKATLNKDKKVDARTFEYLKCCLVPTTSKR
ncbi:MAG: hypothetical protein WAV20_23950 [Blastocatellia bacterium]